MAKKLPVPWLSKLLFRFWPPYRGAGIRPRYIADDWRKVEMELLLLRKNSNYYNTQFGGSLYSMVDPFYVLMLVQNLGKDYIVWDKSASIRFIRPGSTKVHAVMEINDTHLEEIIENTQNGAPYNKEFHIKILDENDEIVAEVDKLIYIKKKKKLKQI